MINEAPGRAGGWTPCNEKFSNDNRSVLLNAQ